MEKGKSIISDIYYSEIVPANKAEYMETDLLEKNFFEENNLDPNGKLATAVSDFALDYSNTSRAYGFIDGFKAAVKLMTEVFCGE